MAHSSPLERFEQRQTVRLRRYIKTCFKSCISSSRRSLASLAPPPCLPASHSLASLAVTTRTRPANAASLLPVDIRSPWVSAPTTCACSPWCSWPAPCAPPPHGWPRAFGNFHGLRFAAPGPASGAARRRSPRWPRAPLRQDRPRVLPTTLRSCTIGKPGHQLRRDFRRRRAPTLPATTTWFAPSSP